MPRTAPAGLVHAETILEIIRTTLRDTPLWNGMRINSNEQLERGPCISQALPRARARPRFKAMLNKHWLRAAGEEGIPFFVARQAEPACFTLRTLDRLGYAQHVPRLAQALDGQCVELEEHMSWYWDHELPQPSGRPTHRNVYELIVYLQERGPFRARAWLKDAMEFVCVSADSRADACVGQLEEAAFGKRLSHTAGPTREGFHVEFDREADARKVVDTVFGDCDSVISRPRKRFDPVVVRVRFRDCVAVENSR